MSLSCHFYASMRCERTRVADGASPNCAACSAANSPWCQKPLESAQTLTCSARSPPSNCLRTDPDIYQIRFTAPVTIRCPGAARSAPGILQNSDVVLSGF